MKRRNFLASIAGLFAAPIIAKEADPVRLTATETVHNAKLDWMLKHGRIYVLKGRRAGFTAKHAEVMRELEKIAGEGQYRWMRENMKKEQEA